MEPVIKKKCGGFQGMGLYKTVIKGIYFIKYSVPTPIQRKVIPLALEGLDIVAMSRTGSGKTAAFLIPMFQKLYKHENTGPRAIIISPTRDLALQTLKFAKDLGRFLDLECAVIIGGDSMESQFLSVLQNPDIIICTPGRFLRVVVEMKCDLSKIQYVVFDEADRLFELGFEEDMKQIIKMLPANRQTLIVSATLPKSLIDFTHVGLHNPRVVRLDVDHKLSDSLKLFFFNVRDVDKLAVLVYLLKEIHKYKELTVVFASTKYHVEMIVEVLNKMNIDAVAAFSSMDDEARKENIEKLRSKKCSILVVTDLAARGLDIPLLDNVINYNLPSKAKVFIHRSGRVARAGRVGNSFSLISPNEIAFLFDIEAVMGRTLQFSTMKEKDFRMNGNGMFGLVPQSVIDSENDDLKQLFDSNDFKDLLNVSLNAEKKFLKFKDSCSKESIEKAKKFDTFNLGFHPFFNVSPEDLSSYGSLFSSHNRLLVAKKGMGLEKVFSARNSLKPLLKNSIHLPSKKPTRQPKPVKSKTKYNSELADFKNSYRSRKFVDTYCVPSAPKDLKEDIGLEINKELNSNKISSSFEFTPDENNLLAKQKSSKRGMKKWDRKKKKFVTSADEERDVKKVKTESGVVVPKSFITKSYDKWLKKTGLYDSIQTDDPNKLKKKLVKIQTENEEKMLSNENNHKKYHKNNLNDTVHKIYKKRTKEQKNARMHTKRKSKR